MDLEKNIDYARRLHETDPEGFKALVADLQSMEPMFREIMQFSQVYDEKMQLSKFTGPGPDRETLERWSIEAANLTTEVRTAIEAGANSLSMVIILEDMKMADRCLQDAADKLLELRREAPSP